MFSLAGIKSINSWANINASAIAWAKVNASAKAQAKTNESFKPRSTRAILTKPVRMQGREVQLS